ncbi:MAG: hypothetical protein WAJ95_02635, partial [Desulfobacterales bacterium]
GAATGPAADCHSQLCKSHTTSPDGLLSVDKAKEVIGFTAAVVFRRLCFRVPFALCLPPLAFSL